MCWPINPPPIQDPLRILIYEEGLVRLCTVKYKEPTAKNMSQTRMHLTNYAINKARKEKLGGKQLGLSWFSMKT